MPTVRYTVLLVVLPIVGEQPTFVLVGRGEVMVDVLGLPPAHWWNEDSPLPYPQSKEPLAKRKGRA